LSAPENRIVRSGGDFPSTSSPDPTTEPADRSSLVDPLVFCAGMLENLAGKPGMRISGTGRRWQTSKENQVLALASLMSRYSLWTKPRYLEEHAFHEKAFRYKDMARWDARWHTLSPQARLAYLKEVKVPQAAQGPNQKRPSVRADRFAAGVLEGLLAAGFVELGDSGAGGSRDRVFAVVDATDFMTRVRALHRHHLLRGDLPSMLERSIRNSFFPPAAAGALNTVLRNAGIQDFVGFDEILRVYVVNQRWPGWVVRSLKDPAAERIVEVVRDANDPVGRAELEKKLPDIAADKLQAALVSLIAHLAVFEDLDPQTCELQVGLLPAVRAGMAAALLHRERPPLVVSENLQIIGPEGSLFLDDLRAFLLEIVSEPPRLRQDDEIFQIDLGRFLEALGDLPPTLLRALELTQEKRLKQAREWARSLKLVSKRIQPKQTRLEISSKGSQWLASSLQEQYGRLYEFLRPQHSNKYGFVPGSPYASGFDSPYSHQESQRQFLGANVTAINTRPGLMPRYYDVRFEDYEAVRDSIYRSFTALPLGVFHRLENVLDHLVFERYNPLLLGLAQEEVAVFKDSSAVPPLDELREQAARNLLTVFLRKRLIPLGCVQAATDTDGNLCIARHRMFDMYFGRKVKEAELPGQAATQTRVVVQPDFSIIIIGLNPAPAAELISFCEREKRGGHGALTLRLTRESVVKAVANGMKPAEIVDRLQRLATNEVPANVLRQVSDWCGWVRRAHASTLMIVRCPDSEAADRIVAVMKRQAERLTETIVAIDQLRLATADRNKLRDQGILIEGKEKGSGGE